MRGEGANEKIHDVWTQVLLSLLRVFTVTVGIVMPQTQSKRSTGVRIDS